MPFLRALGKIFFFGVLYLGALSGVSMRPDEIEELMNAMHRTKIEYVVKKDDPP